MIPIDNTTWDELHRYVSVLETKLSGIRSYLNQEYQRLEDLRDRVNLTEHDRGRYGAVMVPGLSSRHPHHVAT